MLRAEAEALQVEVQLLQVLSNFTMRQSQPIRFDMGAFINNPATFSNPYTAIAAAAIDIGQLISKFFHGCGSPCVEAAATEQVFELAGDYIETFAREGYLSRSEALAALNQIRTIGLQKLASLNTDQSRRGAQNMQNVMQGNFSAASSAPATNSKAWNRSDALQAAQKRTPLTNGWYTPSYQNGVQLAVQIVEQGILPHRSPLNSITKSSSLLIPLAIVAIASRKL